MRKISGFTIVELIIVLTVISILSVIILNSFSSYKNNQVFNNDTEEIMATIKSARNLTLSSKNSSQYGVNFSSDKITLFSGNAYVAGDPDNQDVMFSDTLTVTPNLTTGGSSIVFKRLTGETTNYGSVTITSSKISKTKTITIYQTGLIDIQ